MKFGVFIAAFICVAYATNIENDIVQKEISEALYDTSNISPANIACSVSVHTHLADPQPLLIRPGTEQFFHPTDSRGFIEMTLNQPMELFCTTGFATPSGVSGSLITINCSQGTIFRFNNIFYNMNEFTCRDWPTHVPRRRTGSQRCFNNGIFVDTGFAVSNRFLRVFTTCHDTVTEENYYTSYHITPPSANQVRNVVRPRWEQADFFPGKNVDSLHTRTNQRNTIAAILNSASQAARWIEDSPSDIFLARGHLAAMSDFITPNEQRSTFYFTNTAPQFQTFNGLNWVNVEVSSNHLAGNRNITLETYTGTFGIGQLRDALNTPRQIFLGWPQRQIPMPMLFYKILINRAGNSGVVLLGVNNPHLTLTEILRDYVICSDVADMITWVTWQRTNLHRGYGYACTVNDFINRTRHIPGLSVANLLV
ncbi:CLUMA_CG008438, isoform A [Clunio marinus]|uniref:CLUMA_CG008438, isoform A n=1 Tax=Clunio marinus TaxID=568069 RepID=A0A1J1I7L7_9DIPT|nr:CLUMA_CG008438, isoform A [Clunio marinus]